MAPGMTGGYDVSVGRFPDGSDSDNNCTDFVSQAAANLPVAFDVGTTNVKVCAVAVFAVGQNVRRWHTFMKLAS